MESRETSQTGTIAVPFEVTRVSPYVFEPFAGSLIYMPETLPMVQSTEFLQPQSQLVAFAATRAESPRISETSSSSPRDPLQIDPHAGTREAKEEHNPHIHHHGPIRFFDPAAAYTNSEIVGQNDKLAAAIAAGLPPSIQLPAQLKTSTLDIDERLQQQRTPTEGPALQKSPKKTRAPMPRGSPKIVEPGLERPACESGQTRQESPHAPLPGAQVPDIVGNPPFPQIQPELDPQIESTSQRVQPSLQPQIELPPVERLKPEPKPQIEATQLNHPIPDANAEFRSHSESVGAIKSGFIPDKSSAWHELERPAKKKNLSLWERLQRWLDGDVSRLDGRRRGERKCEPELTAFYWSGGNPKPHEVVNISKSGFYLRTSDLWTANTLVRMNLQRLHLRQGDAKDSISILARVVRIDNAGVGHEFVTTKALARIRSRDVSPDQGTDEKALEVFLESH